jgi:protein TonB
MFAGTLAVLPAIASAQTSVPPRPQNDRATWITRGDYPLQEYVKGVQGTTTFVVQVGLNGRVKSCEIIQSSGSAVLDNTVCALVTARAKFQAARDANGQKVEGPYRNRVYWLIPPEQAAEMEQARAVGERGTVPEK